MNLFGYISTLFLVLCGLPELYYGITTGSVGASLPFVLMWFIGEVSGLIYTLWNRDIPLILNYGLNTLITGCILFIKVGFYGTGS